MEVGPSTSQQQPMEACTELRAVLAEPNLSNASTRSMADRKHYQQLAQLAQSPEEVADVIVKVLESPTVFVFGEILDLGTVNALTGTPLEPYLRLLQVFAYHTYREYCVEKQSNPNSLPDLTPLMVTKLRQLSIISLTRNARIIPYDILLKELDIDNLRQLEDLIIESIYANLLKGVMDQEKACLEVVETMGRDVREKDYEDIVSFLSQWLQDCDKVMANLEQQMTTAARQKEEHLQEKQQNHIKQLAAIQQLGSIKDTSDWTDAQFINMENYTEGIKSIDFNSKAPVGRKPKRKTNH